LSFLAPGGSFGLKPRRSQETQMHAPAGADGALCYSEMAIASRPFAVSTTRIETA